MNINMSHELTRSRQSSKDHGLFRWIILGSIILFLISLLNVPVTATSVSLDISATIPDAIKSAIPEQIATKDIINAEIADREQKISNHYLIIDDIKSSKVQPNRFTIQNQNIPIVSNADNRVVDSATELPDGEFIEFGSDGKTRYFSSDGIEQSVSNDSEANKIRTETGTLISVSHSIEVLDGSTIHRRGKYLHVSDHGKILLTIIDNSQQESLGILGTTQSGISTQDSGVSPQVLWGYWAAWTKYHHSTNNPYGNYDILSFTADWRLPDNLARTNANAEQFTPSNFIFNGIQYTDKLGESVLLQPVTGFNDVYENAWDGYAVIVSSNHWTISTPSAFHLNDHDFISGKMGYLSSSDLWYVYLEDTTTHASCQVFLDDDTLRNYASSDCKSNPKNCKMTNMKNVDLYLTYEAHLCKPNDRSHPELDWTCPVVDCNQAKTTDIEFSAVHAYVDNGQSRVEIENTLWTTRVLPNSNAHPDLTGLHVDAYPHSATIYTSSNYFSITPTSGWYGSISPSTPQTVGKGDSLTFKVIPDIANGYVIDKIIIDDDWDHPIPISYNYKTNDYTFTNVQNDGSIIAIFKQGVTPSYTITPLVIGTGGSISPSTVVTVQADGSQVFTVTANTNYEIDTILINTAAQTITDKRSMTVTVSNVQSNSQISATFKPVTPSSYTITPSSGSGGTIKPSTVVTVTAGESQTFTVTANPNNVIDTILVNTVPQTIINTTTMTVTLSSVQSNSQISATFKPSPPVASFTAIPRAGPAPLTVTFTDTSTGNPTGWAWDFGDGSTTNATRNPVHTYSDNGTYTVNLTATNNGGPNTTTHGNYICVGDCRDTIGVSRKGSSWYLDYNGNGKWDGPTIDKQYTFGLSGDLPATGDWNGDVITEIGVLRNASPMSNWYLDYNGNGKWDGSTIDKQYTFGLSGDLPATGDWNDDGITEIGVLRNGSTWAIDYNGNGKWDGSTIDKQYTFGLSGDLPSTGDWNGDGITEIGVLRNGSTWVLDYNGNGIWNGSTIDRLYAFGLPGDLPATGDWNGDGITEIGVSRKGSSWYLDYNGNGKWDGSTIDKQYTFGLSGDLPSTGKWK